MKNERNLLKKTAKPITFFIFLVSLGFTVFYWVWFFTLSSQGSLQGFGYYNVILVSKYFFTYFFTYFLGINLRTAMLLFAVYNGWYVSKSLTNRFSKWIALIFPSIMIAGIIIGFYGFNSFYATHQIRVFLPNYLEIIGEWKMILSTYELLFLECLAMFIGSIVSLALTPQIIRK